MILNLSHDSQSGVRETGPKIKTFRRIHKRKEIYSGGAEEQHNGDTHVSFIPIKN